MLNAEGGNVGEGPAQSQHIVGSNQGSRLLSVLCTPSWNAPDILRTKCGDFGEGCVSFGRVYLVSASKHILK